LIGLCGTDANADILWHLLNESGIEARLHQTEKRPTIAKTRVMAGIQQVCRIDEENPLPLDSALADALLEIFEREVVKASAVILSDYGKGILQTPDLCQTMIRACRSRSIPVLVDPKGSDWSRYRGASGITPNTAELQYAAGIQTTSGEELQTAADRMLVQTNLEWLLTTRGPKGMLLLSRAPDAEPLWIPALAKEVYDVSGAGDTVIAVTAACLACGLDIRDAATIANTAAGIVVGKLGTQPVLKTELEEALQSNQARSQDGQSRKILGVQAAIHQVRSWQASGKSVVFTNGCFDLLHPGHIHILHEARALGDRLVVGLNSDASVRRLKGPSRPILGERDRAALLSALADVDAVVLFPEDTPIDLITRLKPDILVKGDDYRIDQVVGRQVVESYGGKVMLVPLLRGYSTTGIANRIQAANGET
jgi:D-beta-D-heptose 7-phosphate kinase/D-beta-D-heptose 1-phosphate adenosyltransferase